MMKTKFKSYTIDGTTITDIIKITLIKNSILTKTTVAIIVTRGHVFLYLGP